MDNIEDADIVIDLSGGRLLVEKQRERISQLKAENAKLSLIINQFLHSDWHDDSTVQDFIERFTRALKGE